MQRWLGLLVALLLIWLALVWARDPFERLVLSVQLLDDLRRPAETSWLDEAVPEPRARSITLGANPAIDADVYAIPGSEHAPPILFVPGAVPLGKDDPRVAPFAKLLAQAGFPVVVPNLPALQRLEVHPEDLEQFVAAARALVQHRELAPFGRIGMFGVSYSGGLAMLAALDPRLRDDIQFVATLGAYADLDTMIRFLADGRIVRDGQPVELTPDPYAQMVVTKTFQSHLQGPDRDLYERMIERRMQSADASLEDLAASLSDDARVLYDLFERGREAPIEALMGRLPETMRAHARALSPAEQDFAVLRAKLYLAHDVRDATIPYTETLRIAELAEPYQDVRVLVLDTVRHVAPEPWQKNWKGFLQRDLPEASHMVRWWWRLLSERS